MHELSIMQSIVAACTERAGGAQVIRVRIEVGRLAGVVPEALRFCYDLCADGTPLEDSALEIVEMPAHACCRDCGASSSPADYLSPCPCGSFNLEYNGGDELRIRHMEVM